jgi:hypothetical protein
MTLPLPALIKTVLPFFHPLLMFATFGLGFYALYQGVQVRRTRKAQGDEKKDLIKGKFPQKHFLTGSSFLVLMIVGSLGGIAVTYLNNGKLFVGPHLLAGLGLTALVALSAALAPLMQQGQDWARTLHIALNVSILGILGWQAVTGVQIILRIVDQMAQSVA